MSRQDAWLVIVVGCLTFWCALVYLGIEALS